MASTIPLRTAQSDTRATDPKHRVLTLEDVVGEINEHFDSDPEPGFPSLETLVLLARVRRREGEDLWDLWLRVWELKAGNHSG